MFSGLRDVPETSALRIIQRFLSIRGVDQQGGAADGAGVTNLGPCIGDELHTQLDRICAALSGDGVAAVLTSSAAAAAPPAGSTHATDEFPAPSDETTAHSEPRGDAAARRREKKEKKRLKLAAEAGASH